MITFRELTPKLWPELKELFGTKGACGGCWCMSWRLPKGEKWDDVKGDKSRRRFQKLVSSGKVHGALAFDNDIPIGWVSFDRRIDYDRLNRSPSLACEDAEKVWSIPCFYIRNGYRSKGIASKLLQFSLTALRKRGAKILEGYPVKPFSSGEKIPAAFAWTGTIPMFLKSGFKPVGKRDGGKQRMRKLLGS